MLYRIRNAAFIFLMMLTSFILQYSLFTKIPYMSATPNFMLIIPVAFAYRNGVNYGMVTGFFSGLLIDIFYGQVIGMYALLFVAAGLAAGLLGRKFYSDNFYTPVLILTGCDVSVNILYFIIWFVMHSQFAFGHAFINVIIPEGLLTFLAGVLLFKLYDLIIRKMYQYNKEDFEAI